MLQLAIQYKKLIIGLFTFLYGLIVLYIITGTYLFFTNEEWIAQFFEWSLVFAHAAVITFIVVLLPGIMGRLKIRIQSTFVLTTFRRQLGILMFLFSFTHFYFAEFLFRGSGMTPFLSPLPLFKLFSLVALFFLFLLFLTSNNTAVRILGPRWKRLHQLVYIIVWLLFAHVALQRTSIWSVLLGITALAETLSLVIDFVRKQNVKTEPSSPSSHLP